MQTLKSSRQNSNAQSSRFCQRIGSTVFTVNIHFKEGGKESLEDKMYRMMQSDLQSNMQSALNNRQFCGIIKKPQAETLPERGSV